MKKIKDPKKREALLRYWHRRTDGQKKIRSNLFVKGTDVIVINGETKTGTNITK